MHDEAYAYVVRTLRGRPRPRRVVELGSQNINGGVRALLRWADTYIGVDLQDAPGVDVVADAAIYTPPFAPDLVISTECLEHAPDPGGIVANAERMLAPGGLLIVTAATDPRAPHSGIDGGIPHPGEHYANIAETDLRAWLAPFAYSEIEVDRRIGDIRAWANRGAV